MFKIGDVVVRKPQFLDSLWKQYCKAGRTPEQPVTVAYLSWEDPTPIKFNEASIWWMSDKFDYYLPNTNLEDYV